MKNQLRNSFTKTHPEYQNPTLDLIRKNEFSNLKGVYADWTGAALPPVFLIKKHCEFLQEEILGNPHSHHKPSLTAMNAILETRDKILSYFNDKHGEYEVIFTSNATGAILLLQHYMFEAGELLLTADNHNSVNGLREVARRKGATVRYVPITENLTIEEERLEKALNYPRSWNGNRLFCYPAKSNYSGVMHSLDWVKYAQERDWEVMLDIASYSANSRLDLQKVKPDFAPISFYKLFGYPTGVGCLLIKKEKYKKLHKGWFSGGSILLVSVMMDFFAPESIGYARFEDGTVNFAQIPAVKNGLEFMQTIGDVRPRVCAIASWFHENLSNLSAGDNRVVVYNSRGNDTVSFNIEKKGVVQDSWIFEQAANEAGIFVRTGCFCDPGVNEKLFNYDIKSYEQFYNSEILPEQVTIENLRKYSDKPIGAIRASFGYVNNFTDVFKFYEFTKNYLEKI